MEIEIRAAEGGKDAEDIVNLQVSIYAKVFARESI
jgi:protein subunit release factor B